MVNGYAGPQTIIILWNMFNGNSTGADIETDCRSFMLLLLIVVDHVIDKTPKLFKTYYLNNVLIIRPPTVKHN